MPPPFALCQISLDLHPSFQDISELRSLNPVEEVGTTPHYLFLVWECIAWLAFEL